ncbi:HAD-IIIC family phosphatase [Bacillus inaquosorum]|uniref:type I polyketide synthase n=1 Tax=Bacillus inaquosorum TaxID=483913 RepID=UPI0022828645|nr:type I polyketide synthase [Bacillus inaquosorum]MCY8236590.1 HAD-IIIC family phosphatase [Bacillus inaquosorum]
MSNSHYANHGAEIAVIGMAGRFPGAKNVQEFWSNLKNAKETISFFTDEELREEGVNEELLNDPRFVKAKGIVEDVDLFDAGFFDYTPKEAAMMDPQFRIFHECVWTALEDAGYDPFTYKGQIGLYTGAGLNAEWVLRALQGAKSGEDSKTLETAVLNMRDYMATLISYKLNLKGPSMMVQTACSTSMVSIHLAAQALLNGDCHMAVAGGVSIRLPQKSGYLYQEGMIHSPDGHCRVFDDEAAGTVFGDGAGAVILKTLEDAEADGDHIYAVIKGTAINNDGSRKVGYTAPSTKGQVTAIKTALHMAEVEPETITYVEAHGTGTTLGDPIEIEALKQAYQTDRRGYCRIGSVKSNIGHLNDASGVAGFMKAVLSLKHKVIPPTLNFEKPNTKIDFEQSPFVVNTKLTPWEENEFPRRAGVSSFGIGGTNAHVILEEAPAQQKAAERHDAELLLLSAKTPAALNNMTDRLSNYFVKNPQANLAAAAYTLKVGRHSFPYKKAIVAADVPELLQAIHENDYESVKTGSSQSASRPVVFLFPGQGAQYVDMAKGLYDTVPIFKEELDACFDILKNHMDTDPRTVLFSDNNQHDAKLINQTEYTQPLLFCIEYSLAKMLIHWGIKPKAMAGHSIGEYTAAAISGVLSLEDALDIVSYRGAALQNLPSGSMLSVSLSEADIKPYTDGTISIAAVNASDSCVVSGESSAIDALERKLNAEGHSCRKLHTSHAFHSYMMEPVLESMKQKLSAYQFKKQKIPFVSNVTGDWITDEEAGDPSYWADHLRGTVRFMNCAKRLKEELDPIFIEVGPGNALRSFVSKLYQAEDEQHIAIQLMRHPKEAASDYRYLLSRLGEMWLHGVPVDWTAFYDQEQCQLIPLPTYPFERERYWIGRINEQSGTLVAEKFQLLVPEQANDGQTADIESDVQFNETEAVLAAMWKDILGVKRVTLDTHFFETGGHSLNATGLISRIHKEFGAELTLSDVFQHPTIRALAALIERSDRNQYTSIQPSEKKDVYRLSAAQRRTYLIHQRIGQVTTYNMPMALLCFGKIDAARFEDTFKKLIERHETLRTTFEIKDGEPVQRIHQNFDFSIEQTEAKMDELDDEISSFIRPFDLKVSPLIRVKFVKIEEEKHALLVDMHNIVADGASMNIFIKEFTQLYRGEQLPEKIIQYKDYAEWQQTFFNSDMFKRQKEYWLKQLEGEVPVLNMPLDYERKEQSFLGRAIKFTIPPRVLEKLEKIGEAQQLTNNVILFQLYAMLLSSYSKQQELMIGSLVAGRRHADIENTIGMFTNFLPIKIHLNPEESFAGNHQHTKQTLLEAYDHQDYPYDQMAEALQPVIKPNRNPFFDTMLIYHNEYDPNIKIEAGGLTFETYEFAKGISKLDMKMDVVKEVTGELKCVLQYNRSLFTHESMQAFVSHFISLAEKAAEEPEKRIKDIPVLSQKEQEEAERKRERESNRVISCPLTICSNFTADPIVPYLKWWGEQFDINLDIKLSPYGQVFQELLNEESLLSRQKNGANLLLIRLEDMAGDSGLSLEERMAHVQYNSDELLAIMKQKKKEVPYFIGLLPLENVKEQELRDILVQSQQNWIAQLAGETDVHLIDLRQLHQTYQLDAIFDPRSERAARIPFTEEFYAAMGTRVAREFAAWLKPPFKAAAIDCDGTLWSGTVSEVGPEGVMITPAHRALQQFLKRKQEEGLLLVLSSRNNEEDVWNVFERHPDMILKKEDFVLSRINWNEKARNMKEMADELNISVDRFIFLDDDPAQCLEMNERLPEVLTLLLPSDTDSIPMFLDHVWAFDRFRVTEADQKRTERYLAAQERKIDLNTSRSLEDFLSGLHLRIALTEMTEEHLPRVAQMSARINQFNMNPSVYREEQLAQRLNTDGHIGWIVEAADRFSDEGIVGAIMGIRTEDSLKLDTFLLSCRALGKGIEHKVLSGLASYARDKQLATLSLEYKKSEKNRAFSEFLAEHRFKEEAGPLKTVYHITVDEVEDQSGHIEWASSLQPAPRKKAKVIADDVLQSALMENTNAHWEVLHAEKSLHSPYLMALDTNQPEHLRALLVKEHVGAETEDSGPETEQQKILLDIWKEILHLDYVGIDNDFFDLGGNSLLAVKMEVDMEKKGWYVDDLNLAKKHTIRELSKYMKRENQHA